MADDRLLCCRSFSIAVTRAVGDMWRSCAISFSALQKSSSRLILVLWPVMRMERLTTGDFISASPKPRPLGWGWGGVLVHRRDRPAVRCAGGGGLCTTEQVW